MAGLRNVPRPLAIAALAGTILVAMVSLPVVGGTGSTREAVTERLGSYFPAAEGGLSQRFVIWTTAAGVYLGAPGVDTERFLPLTDPAWAAD